MIRIILVITELDFGGAERSLTELASGLPASDFQTEIVALGPPPPTGREALVDRLNASQIALRFLDGRGPRDFWRVRRELADILRERQPDIVQCFLWHANLLGSLAARRAGRPPVVLGIRVREPSRPRRFIEQQLARRAAAVVCVSRDVADHLVHQLPKSAASRVQVIPNGVDVTRWESGSQADLADAGIPPNAEVVLYVGRLDPQKGLDVFLPRAAAALARRPSAHLVLVGDGPQWGKLEPIAKASPQVHLLGWRRDVPSLMRRANLLVLPSRWEGMPNVVLEAMAAGLPVVATRTSGVTELVRDDTDLQLADVDDVDGFVKRMLACLEHPKRAADAGAANRRHVVDSFSLPAMISAYADLYRRVAESNGAPASSRR